MLPRPCKSHSFHHHATWLRLFFAQLRTTWSYRRKRQEVVRSLQGRDTNRALAPLGIELGLDDLSASIVAVLRSGEYELPELAICERLVRSDDRVIEVGSAIGYIGLFCQTKLGVRDYLSVEPHPKTIEILKANYRRNNVQPQVLSFALTRTDCIVELSSGPDFWSNRLTSPIGCAGATVKCEGRSLNSLLQATPFQPTTFIVDIEGAENEVEWEVLPSSIRTVIVELHPHSTSLEQSFATLDKIMTMGFAPSAHAGCTVGLTR